MLNFNFMIETPTYNKNIKKYKIEKLTSHQFKNFLELNCQIYPNRKNIEERFKYQILNNPLLEDKSNTFILLAYSEENKIVGQLVCNPYEYFLGKTYLKGFNICDFYVLEDYRKKGIGSSLVRTAITNLKPCTLVKVTEVTKKICLSNRLNIIGYLYNYIWFRNSLCVIKALIYSLFKRLCMTKILNALDFPGTLNVNNFTFIKVNSLDKWKCSKWDDNTFVFGRSKEFMKWRFFQNPEAFHFYLLDETEPNTYFVMKRSHWRELNIVEIIDYRVPSNDTKKFELILKAIKLLVKIANLDGVIITSSHRFFDDLLKKSFFFKGKQSDEIILSGDINVDEYKNTIKKRNFVVTTTIDLAWYGF